MLQSFDITFLSQLCGLYLKTKRYASDITTWAINASIAYSKISTSFLTKLKTGELKLPFKYRTTDLQTPEIALDSLLNVDRKILEYSPSDGIKSLRLKLVEYYKRFNINVDVSI